MRGLIDNSVNIGGNQTITGVKTFPNSPLVNTTSDQTIAGVKTFSSRVMAAAATNNGSAITTTARSSSANGYVKFGNHVTIQKGTMSAGSGTSHTITFPTPFNGTNYKFTHTFTSNTGEIYAGAINTKTTTNLVLHTVGGANTMGCDWIAVEIY